jgi:4,4'-diaponeurosporenoate glycosyltransferase
VYGAAVPQYVAEPSIVSLSLFVLGWAAGWLALWRVRPVPPGPRRSAPMSVVVPARDEAASLPALLASLAGEIRPGDEVIVVDDHSVDGTARIASDAGAIVVAAPDLPMGWAGKPHACHVGARRATNELLVFLDADVSLAPGALDSLAFQLSGHPDELISLQPHHVTCAAHEQASAVFNVVALMGSGAFTPWGERVQTHVAFGPVIAVRRPAYDRAGGHAHSDVRAAVLEDIALARRFPRSRLFSGGSTGTSFRMYPRDLRQVIEGWTKGVGIGFDATPWWASVLTAAWVTSLAGGVLTSIWFACASMAQFAVFARKAGRFRMWTIVVFPVWVVLLVVVLARSLWRRRTGGTVTWKGRAIRPDQETG